MKTRIGSALLWTATFAVPFLFYLFVWELIGRDVLNRAGYLFWLIGGTQAQTTIFRIDLFESLSSFLPGVLLGVAALGWRAVILRRRARKG